MASRGIKNYELLDVNRNMVKKRKTKKQVGRPTKLTPEIREELFIVLKWGTMLKQQLHL